MKTYFQGFVCDEDCEVLEKSVPRRFGLRSLEEIGISKGTDDAVVIRHARENGVIIITKNEVDFEQAMWAAPSACNSQKCRCGCGLVTVSANLQTIPFERMTKGLSVGGFPITWLDVFEANLQVSVRADESFEVTRFPICKWETERHLDCEGCTRINKASPLPPR